MPSEATFPERIELKRISRDEESGNVFLSFLLTLDGKAKKSTLCVGYETAKALELRRGYVERETYEKIKKESERLGAYRRGMTILSYGANSKKALERKLAARGFCADSVNEAVESLENKGYIDEDSGARGVAVSEIRKLYGERRIYEKLRQKGYTSPFPESVREVIEQTDFPENCARLIKKKYGSFPKDRADADKVIAALVRYGYTFSQIKNAISMLSGEK